MTLSDDLMTTVRRHFPDRSFVPGDVLDLVERTPELRGLREIHPHSRRRIVWGALEAMRQQGPLDYDPARGYRLSPAAQEEGADAAR